VKIHVKLPQVFTILCEYSCNVRSAKFHIWRENSRLSCYGFSLFYVNSSKVPASVHYFMWIFTVNSRANFIFDVKIHVSIFLMKPGSSMWNDVIDHPNLVLLFVRWGQCCWSVRQTEKNEVDTVWPMSSVATLSLCSVDAKASWLLLLCRMQPSSKLSADSCKMICQVCKYVVTGHKW